jgi:hypothetical protein
VGARAEATLPPEFWKEMLVLLHHNANAYQDGSTQTNLSGLNITLDFVGPDVISRSKDLVLSYHDSSLTLSWSRGGGRLFHQLEPEDKDAFVFFNPGFGHPNLQASWQPTLETLFHQHTPPPLLLFTAHSPLDVQRDVQVLQQYHVMRNVHATDYALNPFASRIVYADPFLKGHLVQPNLYAYHNYAT